MKNDAREVNVEPVKSEDFATPHTHHPARSIARLPAALAAPLLRELYDVYRYLSRKAHPHLIVDIVLNYAYGEGREMAHQHVQDHIDLIAKHEQDFLAQRTHAEKLGDSIAAFAGSIGFVACHLTAFLLWIAVNVIPGRTHFDPAPFSLLGTVVAMEGIVLASFILMRQTRIGRRADEREHLMLQILLLTEKEITAVLKMDRKIAQHVGLDGAANSEEAMLLSQKTSIDDMAKTIKESLDTAE